MMAGGLLDSLVAKGVKVSVKDGDLWCRVPKGVDASDELGALREHKGAAIALLSATPFPVPPPFEALIGKAGFEVDARCAHCGARATILRCAGAWECDSCTDLPPPLPLPADFPEPETEPDMAEYRLACAAYREMHGAILDIQGAANRAREAGDIARAGHLKAEARTLIARLNTGLGRQIMALAEGLTG